MFLAFGTGLALGVGLGIRLSSCKGRPPFSRGLLDRLLDRPCRCGYLQDAADEPDSGIKFDRVMNEFQFVHVHDDGTTSFTVLYRCPSCGGSTPRSLREKQFAHIPDREQRRLTDLLIHLKTEREVLEKLGPPTWESECGITQNEHTKVYRVLMYEELSAVASVGFRVNHDGTVGFGLNPKYTGPRRDVRVGEPPRGQGVP